VYVHSNLRLLGRITAVDYTETSIEWEQWAVEDSADEADNDDHDNVVSTD
jgi:hypothetical protein